MKRFAVLFGGSYLVMLLVFSLIFGTIGAFAWPYTLNTWLVFVGKEASVLWWHGFLLGLIPFFGYWALPGAAATWIIGLFLL